MTKKEISQILSIDLNNPEYLKQEMINAIDKLLEHKTKKFYHLMMAELAEMGI